MAVTFRAITTATKDAVPGDATIVLNKPTGTARSDVLVAWFFCTDIGGITPPSGWTAGPTTNYGSLFGFCYYKVAGASEPSSYSFTLNIIPQGTSVAAFLAAYDGVETTGPINVSGTNTHNNTTSHASPSVTTTVADTMVLCCYGIAIAANPTADATTTDRGKVYLAGAQGNVAVLLADFAQATAGATGAKTATTGTAVPDVIAVLALAPALPPTGSISASSSPTTLGVIGSAAGISPPAGHTIASYDWDWGDGSAHGSGVSAGHFYDLAGTFTITLTVELDDGGTFTFTQEVTIMAEDAAVYQGIQLGAETVAGTAVAASKRLRSFELDVDPIVPTEIVQTAGGKFVEGVVLGKEHTEATIKGKLAYNDIAYLLSSILCSPVITTPGGGTNTRRWTFLPSHVNPDVFKTFTVEKGMPDHARRFTYGIVQELELTFSKSDCSVAGKMLGQELTEGIRLSTNEAQTVTITGSPTGGTFTLTFGGQTTAGIAYNAAAAAVQTALEAISTIGAGNVSVTGGPGPATAWVVEFIGNLAQTDVAQMTASAAGLTGGTSPAVTVTTTTPGVAPTVITVVPVAPTQVSVYVADSVSGLSSGKLNRCLQVSLGIRGRHVPVFTLDGAEGSYTTTVEATPDVSGQVVVEQNSAADAYMTALRAATKKFARIKATGPLIEGSLYYDLQLTFPFKFRNPKRGAQDDVYAGTYDLQAVYDASDLGGGIQAILDCTLTGL